MRFSKLDVLQVIRRQDVAFRLSILASQWLRGGYAFEPSAVSYGNGLSVDTGIRTVNFRDVATLLADPQYTASIVGTFMDNQLHALLRTPYEVIDDYCHDYDAAVPGGGLQTKLKAESWYQCARFLRHATAHNLLIEIEPHHRKYLPVTWHRVRIDESCHGKHISDILDLMSAIELFLAMNGFALALPEAPLSE